MNRRYTGLNTPFVISDRRRNDGSRFEISDKPMTRIEALYWCAFYAAITLSGIALCLYYARGM